MRFGVIGPPGGIRPGGQKHKSVLQTLFDVDSKYTPIKMIGRGSYGLVCSATDITTGDKVAIKKIHAALGNRIEVLMALREMYLLRILKHKNVVDLKHVMMPAEKLAFQDVYLVYELMETDLKQVIQSSQPLSEEHCRYCVYQIMRGLQHVHACNVIHRDLKQGNLFINLDSELKIGDFGLAKTAGGANESMTEYVTTRFYRAPDVFVSNKNYGAAVDIWSVGCIMAEILSHNPLFPGKDSLDQLELIVRTLRSQVQSEMGFISSPLVRIYIEPLPYSDGVRFSDLYPEASPMAIDLMERMLVFDPSRRLTATKALHHPYLAGRYDPSTDVAAKSTESLKAFNRMIECILRKVIHQEMRLYNISYYTLFGERVVDRECLEILRLGSNSVPSKPFSIQLNN